MRCNITIALVIRHDQYHVGLILGKDGNVKAKEQEKEKVLHFVNRFEDFNRTITIIRPANYIYLFYVGVYLLLK